MENAIAVLQVLAKVLSIATVALVAAVSQYDHDIEEVGRSRNSAILIFALWAGIGAFISSYGNWLASCFVIAFSALASVFAFKGRADNLALSIIGATLLHIISPILAGRILIWNGWTTLVAVVAVAGLAVIAIFAHQQGKTTAQDPPSCDSARNPFVIPVAICGACAIASVVALSVLVA